MDYNIKIGDIFYSNTNIKKFVKVIGFKAKKQIIVQDLEKNIIGRNGANDSSLFIQPGAIFKETSKPVTKTVLKDDDGRLYISIKHQINQDMDYYHRHKYYLLTEDEKLEDDMYNVWYR